VAGNQGIQGGKGDPGGKGNQGVKGDSGNQGVKGDSGDQGVKGDSGDQGVKGDKGDPGTAVGITAGQSCSADGITGKFVWLDISLLVGKTASVLACVRI
jgi:hypothetical protein